MCLLLVSSGENKNQSINVENDSCFLQSSQIERGKFIPEVFKGGQPVFSANGPKIWRAECEDQVADLISGE